MKAVDNALTIGTQGSGIDDNDIGVAGIDLSQAGSSIFINTDQETSVDQILVEACFTILFLFNEEKCCSLVLFETFLFQCILTCGLISLLPQFQPWRSRIAMEKLLYRMLKNLC